jgi:hypothetical protein
MSGLSVHVIVYMRDTVRTGPQRKTRERRYAAGKAVWCGSSTGMTPVAILPELSNRTFTRMC